MMGHMKTSLLVIGLLIVKSNSLISQDIAGLSYCLLFDSQLEKQAFQKNNSDDCDPIIFLLAYDPEIDSTKYVQVKEELANYAEELKTKQEKYKSEERFLHYVFYKVHREYLKNYENAEPFNGLFNGGTYNCVSGTALYACLLTQLGYAPKIYETRYHIFLVVDLQNGQQILFETTDPFDGFVEGREKIGKRIERYLAGERSTLARRLTLSAPFNSDKILEVVSLKELAGLHYYNLAVDLINKENYYDAFRALKKAAILYPESQRVKDFLWFTHEGYESQLSTAFVNN